MLFLAHGVVDQPEESVFILYVVLVADVWVGLLVELPGALSDGAGNPVVVPLIVHLPVLVLEVAPEGSEDPLHDLVVLGPTWRLSLGLLH